MYSDRVSDDYSELCTVMTVSDDYIELCTMMTVSDDHSETVDSDNESTR